jgi:hypothetical protein
LTRTNDVVISKRVLEYSDLIGIRGIEYTDDCFIFTRVKVNKNEYHYERVVIPCDEANWKTFTKYYFNK